MNRKKCYNADVVAFHCYNAPYVSCGTLDSSSCYSRSGNIRRYAAGAFRLQQVRALERLYSFWFNESVNDSAESYIYKSYILLIFINSFKCGFTIPALRLSCMTIIISSKQWIFAEDQMTVLSHRMYLLMEVKVRVPVWPTCFSIISLIHLPQTHLAGFRPHLLSPEY